MSNDDEAIHESALSQDEAIAAVKKRAVEKWGDGNFNLTTTNAPSKNITSGQNLCSGQPSLSPSPTTNAKPDLPRMSV